LEDKFIIRRIYASTPSRAICFRQTEQEVAQGLADVDGRHPDARRHHDLRFDPGRFAVVAGRRNYVLLKASRFKRAAEGSAWQRSSTQSAWQAFSS
jgi:hypothetical protein